MLDRPISPSRRAYIGVMGLLCALSVLLVCALALFLIGYVLAAGLPNLSWELLTTKPSYLSDTIGILPDILNTIYIILGVTAALIVSLVLMVAGISDPEVIDAMAAQGAEIDLEDQQTLKYIKSMDQLAFVHETLGSGFLLVIAHDDIVDQCFDRVKQVLIGNIAANPDCGEHALDLLMIDKYLERIGDHAVNIAEWVIFAVTGEHKGEAL